MGAYIASTMGMTGMLFVGLVVVLAIGMHPRLSPHPLGVHVAAVILVWIAAACMHTPAGTAVSAYLITLLAIYVYRRVMEKPPSGWYRLGVGLTAVWLVLGLLFLASEVDAKHPSAEVYAIGGWIFAALGMLPWLLGWLGQWIAAGFRARRLTDAAYGLRGR